MHEIISKFAEEMTKLLCHKVEDLVSIALYGSAARGHLREGSDIDFLVVLKKAPSSYHKRVKSMLKILYKAEDVMKILDKIEICVAPMLLILTKEEIKSILPSCWMYPMKASYSMIRIDSWRES